jgi:hypothetical protein
MPILGIMASQMSGKLWQPDGAFDALATVTVPSGGLTSISFGAIPNTYRHLQIRGTWANAGTNQYAFIRFNGDTASNYAWHDVYGDGASAITEATANASAIAMAYSSSTTSYTGFVYDILDYTSTTKNKTVRGLEGRDTNGGGAIALHSGLWFKTPEAITSIDIFVATSSNIRVNSQFSLYGVR